MGLGLCLSHRGYEQGFTFSSIKYLSIRNEEIQIHFVFSIVRLGVKNYSPLAAFGQQSYSGNLVIT